MHKEMQESTFLHEVIHALIFYGFLGSFHPQQQEGIAREIAEGLYPIIKDILEEKK